MRIIAFVTDGVSVCRILTYIGEPTEPPRIAPARGPPDWESETEPLLPADQIANQSLTSNSTKRCTGDPTPVTRSSRLPHPLRLVDSAPRAVPRAILGPRLLKMSHSAQSDSDT